MQNYNKLFQLLQQTIINEQMLLNQREPKQMYEPMGYILGLGGKRVRPLLTLVGCDLFNVNPQHALQSSLAVELFHNFSLIHDDILDKAPLRRGNTTIHQKWNLNIAILSGDGMMAKAFETLCKSNPVHINDLLKLFSKTAIEVCEGQQHDMDFETQANVTVTEYIHMITFKTAVLLGCSLQMGAICANANTSNQQHIYEFGKNIGIAFQILDDVLDVYADDDKFGKQVGGDILANKKTFLLLKCFELANTKQKVELSKLLSENNINTDIEKVKQVTELYNALNIKDIAFKEADNYTQIALEHLQLLEADESKKNALKLFALQLVNRDV